MMQIALNARFLAHRPTGMQRYALELSRRFASYLDPLSPRKPLRGPSGHLWEQLYLPSAVRGRLLWSPNNTGPLAISKQVCTIHDLIPLDHPEWFNQRFAQWYGWLLPRLAQRVQRIIAVSEFTRQRIIELLGVPAQRVVVIHNGVDAHLSPRKPEEILAARRAIGIESSPYLLCVGSLEPRKNLTRLMEAWRAAQSMVPDNVVLVVAGGSANARVFGPALMQTIPPRVHFAGYVADAQLPALYSGALAVVYPSLYEGFGLPPLEAMACGVPVVTSINTSLPEVVGEAPVLVDPESAESIKDGILRVVGSQELRDDLRQKGLARAARFTWERTASQTLELLLQQA